MIRTALPCLRLGLRQAGLHPSFLKEGAEGSSIKSIACCCWACLLHCVVAP